jgi:RHS repeat-associated protein
MILHSSGLLMQENHYYPYGMLIEGLSNMGTGLPQNMYRYTDKEAQNDLNQNLLDFGWRQYDPVIARWHVTDPAEQFYNPYFAISGNPVSIIDPDGRKTHSGMSGTSTKPFDMVLLPDIENGLGGWGGGGGFGTTLAQQAAAYHIFGTPMPEYVSLMSNGTIQTCNTCVPVAMSNGAVVLTDVNTGAAVTVINSANSNYSTVNGQVVNLNLTQTISVENWGYSYGPVTETYNNYISVQQGGGLQPLDLSKSQNPFYDIVTVFAKAFKGDYGSSPKMSDLFLFGSHVPGGTFTPNWNISANPVTYKGQTINVTIIFDDHNPLLFMGSNQENHRGGVAFYEIYGVGPWHSTKAARISLFNIRISRDNRQLFLDTWNQIKGGNFLWEP